MMRMRSVMSRWMRAISWLPVAATRPVWKASSSEATTAGSVSRCSSGTHQTSRNGCNDFSDSPTRLATALVSIRVRTS